MKRSVVAGELRTSIATATEGDLDSYVVQSDQATGREGQGRLRKDTDGRGLPRPYTVRSFKKKVECFKELMDRLTLQNVEATAEEKRQVIADTLRFEQFSGAIRAIFGPDIKNVDLKSLFKKISANPDADVDWSELFGYAHCSEDQTSTNGSGLNTSTTGRGGAMTQGGKEECGVFSVPYRTRVGFVAGNNKRRDISRSLRYVPQLDCYISASQNGVITAWGTGNDFELLDHFKLKINAGSWLADCDYMPVLRRMACLTEKSLVVWGSRGQGNNRQLFVIGPFPYTLQSMAVVTKPCNETEDCLVIGDSQGHVNYVTVAAKDLSTKNSTAIKKLSDCVTLIFIDVLKLSKKFGTKKLHKEAVSKVKFIPNIQCFASCSLDEKVSFYLEDVDKLASTVVTEFSTSTVFRCPPHSETRQVGVHRGVNCFQYSSSANVIATGGCDKIIRVWLPHIFSRPTAKLIGHLFTIVDICINDRDMHIISLSAARIIRVWDIHTMANIQIFSDNQARLGERRIYCMLFDPKSERLLTASSVIDCWPLTRRVQDSLYAPLTHERPLTQFAHNEELRQLVTVCSDSVLKVWECDTGRLLNSIAEPHGAGDSVAAICFDDEGGYRMATASAKGSIKIWDFGAGLEIKHNECKKAKANQEKKSERMSASSSASSHGNRTSVSGIILLKYITGEARERQLIAISANKKVRVYSDPDGTKDLPLVRVCHVIEGLTRTINGDIDTEDNPSHQLSRVSLPYIGQQGVIITGAGGPESLESVSLISAIWINTNSVVFSLSDGRIVSWDYELAEVNSEFQSVSQMNRDGKEIDSVNAVHVLHTANSAWQGKSKRSGRLSGAGRRPWGESKEMRGASKRASCPAVPELTRRRVSGTNPLSGVPESEGKLDSESREQSTDCNRRKQRQTVIVTAHNDCTVRFWSVDGSQLLYKGTPSTRSHPAPITSLSSTPDGSLVAVGNSTGYIALYQLKPLGTNLSSQRKDQTSASSRTLPSVSVSGHTSQSSASVRGQRQGSSRSSNRRSARGHEGLPPLAGENQRSASRKKSTDESPGVTQLLSWKAHTKKIVWATFSNTQNTLFSASVDGSVRIWSAEKGQYIGFLGQAKSLSTPAPESSFVDHRPSTADPPRLPVDIKEKPLKTAEIHRAAARKRRREQTLRFPLKICKERWPTTRERAHDGDTTSKDQHVLAKGESRFFQALAKPQSYNHHLVTISEPKHLPKDGFVFRTLPVYRVDSPTMLTKPRSNFSPTMAEEESAVN